MSLRWVSMSFDEYAKKRHQPFGWHSWMLVSLSSNHYKCRVSKSPKKVSKSKKFGISQFTSHLLWGILVVNFFLRLTADDCKSNSFSPFKYRRFLTLETTITESTWNNVWLRPGIVSCVRTKLPPLSLHIQDAIRTRSCLGVVPLCFVWRCGSRGSCMMVNALFSPKQENENVRRTSKSTGIHQQS